MAAFLHTAIKLGVDILNTLCNPSPIAATLAARS